MNTINDAEFNRQYKKLEKILQHYKQFYGDELWWDQSFGSFYWEEINKEYIYRCWVFPGIEAPTCSCICPPGTYHPVSKIILELVNNYPLKIKEEEIRKAKLRIECDFTPNGFPPPPEVENVIE